MKTKILFVITYMGLGGAEKALVNLLNSLDYKKYDIDLLVLKKDGFNLEYIPKEVHYCDTVIDNTPYYQQFWPLIKYLFKKKEYRSIVLKCLYLIRSFVVKEKNNASVEYYTWQYLKNYIPGNKSKYDVAVGYVDGLSHYYVIDKVQADKKICWVHNDYSNVEKYKKNLVYLRNSDIVITVSHTCEEKLKEYFPELKNTMTLYNISLPQMVREMAQESFPQEYIKAKGKCIIVSVGRLTKQKAFHYAIKAAEILKMKGREFVWFVIGDGELQPELEKLISLLKVEDAIYLLGKKENPYPYMENCDIIVQCSLYEGKSVVLDEAKILNKPIVCTEYNTSHEQIENGVTGLIVPMSVDGVVHGIEKMMDDENFKRHLISNLKKLNFDQTELILAHEEVLEGN